MIKRLDGSRWQALVKPAKKLSPGDTIRFGNEGKVCLLGHLDATVEAEGQEGEVTLSFSFHGPALDQAIADARRDAAAALHRLQAHPPDDQDVSDYQTMFAANEGAVAAPTAGLHFTPALDAALRDRGVALHRLTLHVGAGTFLPVKTEETSEHKMHAEWGCISAETASALNAARAKRRPDRRDRHHVASPAGKRHDTGRRGSSRSPRKPRFSSRRAIASARSLSC